MGQCLMYLKNKVFGEVSWAESPLFVHYSAKALYKRPGIVRAYVCHHSAPKKRLLIGVMQPFETALKAEKKYSKSEINESGIDFTKIDLAYAEINNEKRVKRIRELSIKDWKKPGDIYTFIKDKDLIDTLNGVNGLLFKKSDGGTLLAAPLRPDGGFPFESAFAISTVYKIGSVYYYVIKISDDGLLTKAGS